MTRINLIPPRELHDRHLVAEYRELPRVFALIRAHFKKSARPELPDSYRMGKGHVLFFYDKAPWLAQRQALLIAEMRRRGMHPNFDDVESLLDGIDLRTQTHVWTPTEAEVSINRRRIEERLSGMKSRIRRGGGEPTPARSRLPDTRSDCDS